MRPQIIGKALAAWSFSFGCVHLAWAAGWRGGLDESFESIFERPWFLAYDVLAGLLMIAAAGGALHLASGSGTERLRRVTRVASILALLRGAPALVMDAAAGDFGVVSFGADLWFTVAGIAGILLWASTRSDQAFSPVGANATEAW